MAAARPAGPPPAWITLQSETAGSMTRARADDDDVVLHLVAFNFLGSLGAEGAQCAGRRPERLYEPPGEHV